MANSKHLNILQQGILMWNAWRENNPEIAPDLSQANLKGLNLEHVNLNWADLRESVLEGTNLSAAHLDRANLTSATLFESNLSGADLSNANLSEADLRDANLYGAVLNNANLYHADLNNAILWEAQLEGADLTEAIIMWTLFGNNDLSATKGLDHVRHVGPATLGVDTLYKSGGKIPERFLRGCGVPDNLIAYLPSLVGAQQALQFYSCFISYSHRDEEFAKRLNSRMREAGLRVWYAPEDIQGGQKLHEQIDRAIQLHDRLLLVLSAHSMQSEWVMTEIRRARKTEREENRRKLFPIRLVDFDVIQRWECFDADSGKDLGVELREYYIPDFSKWKDHDAFEAEFDNLLRDLKAQEKPKTTRDQVENRGLSLVPEFEEIKANIILSTLAPFIAAELKRLKAFIHRHSFLLNRKDVREFYNAWIVPFEIHLEYGASLDLKQAQYEQMKEQLASIDLQKTAQE